VPKQPFRSGTN